MTRLSMNVKFLFLAVMQNVKSPAAALGGLLREEVAGYFDDG
jgi:hypothetical protein